MAHEIEAVTINGQQVFEAIYAGEPAWHRLGTVIRPGEKGGMTSREIMAQTLAWRVALKRMKVEFDDGDVEVPDRYAVVRADDTRKILGVVGSDYTPFQNEEAFEFLDSLVSDGALAYESAFATGGGRRVVIAARMPSYDTIAEGDVSARYIMLATSHDGSRAITMTPTSVRVVCANTYRLALREGTETTYSVPHTGNVRAQMERAAQYLSQFDDQFTLFCDHGRALAEKRVTVAQRDEYLQTLFPLSEDAGDLAVRNRQRRISSILGHFTHGARNNMPSITGSWWAIWNAVTEHVDHESNYRGSDRTQAERRFEQLIYGEHASLKTQAFKLALQMSA